MKTDKQLIAGTTIYLGSLLWAYLSNEMHTWGFVMLLVWANNIERDEP